MTWLTRWPLGDASRTVTQLPTRTRPCSPYVALLGDWHDAPRGGGAPHYAQDIMAPRGTPVVAPCDGRVRFAGWGEVGGYQVSIATQGGRVQLSHLDVAPLVREGQTVRAGDPIGLVGNTGRRASRTCPHLHVGVKNAQGQPVNIYSELRALAPPRRVRPGPTPDAPVVLPESAPAAADGTQTPNGNREGVVALMAILAAAGAAWEAVVQNMEGRRT